MGDCWEEFEAMDRLAKKNAQSLVEGVDLICAFQQAEQEMQKEIKLKKYQMGFFYDFEFVKNFGRTKGKRNGRIRRTY